MLSHLDGRDGVVAASTDLTVILDSHLSLPGQSYLAQPLAGVAALFG
jgi:hypothetical protein